MSVQPYYALFDYESMNQIADFETEAEAFAEVVGLAEVNGAERLGGLALQVHGGTDIVTIASGAELVERARRHAPRDVAA